MSSIPCSDWAPVGPCISCSYTWDRKYIWLSVRNSSKSLTVHYHPLAVSNISRAPIYNYLNAFFRKHHYVYVVVCFRVPSLWVFIQRSVTFSYSRPNVDTHIVFLHKLTEVSLIKQSITSVILLNVFKRHYLKTNNCTEQFLVIDLLKVHAE